MSKIKLINFQNILIKIGRKKSHSNIQDIFPAITSAVLTIKISIVLVG